VGSHGKLLNLTRSFRNSLVSENFTELSQPRLSEDEVFGEIDSTVPSLPNIRLGAHSAFWSLEAGPRTIDEPCLVSEISLFGPLC
jgi:hypothetical protein